MDEDNKEVTIPFEKNKLYAFLGHLLKRENYKFFVLVKDRIQPGWFHHPYCNKVYTALRQFHDNFSRCPLSIEEFKNFTYFQLESQVDRVKCYDIIATSLLKCEEYGLDALKLELTEWLHSVMFQGAFIKAGNLYNAKKLKESLSLMEQAVKDIKNAKFYEEKEEVFDDYVREFEEIKKEFQGAPSFGLTIFDKLLNPKVVSGGALLLGDLSVVLAASSSGKTTSLITTLAHNIQQGVPVLFIPHEGRPSDLKEKIWCAMLDCSPRELYGFQNQDGSYNRGLYETPEGRAKLDFMVKFLGR